MTSLPEHSTLQQALDFMAETLATTHRSIDFYSPREFGEKPEPLDSPPDETDVRQAGLISWPSRITATIPAYISALRDTGNIPNGIDLVVVFPNAYTELPEHVREVSERLGIAFLGCQSMPEHDPLSRENPKDAAYLDAFFPFVVSQLRPARFSPCCLSGNAETLGWLYELYHTLTEHPYLLLPARGWPDPDKLDEVQEELSFLSQGILSLPNIPQEIFSTPYDVQRHQYLAVPEKDSLAWEIWQLCKITSRLADGAEAIAQATGISTSAPLRENSAYHHVLSAAGFEAAARKLLRHVPDWEAYDKWYAGILKSTIFASDKKDRGGRLLVPHVPKMFASLPSSESEQMTRHLKHLANNLLGHAESEPSWTLIALNDGPDMQNMLFGEPEELDAQRDGEWMLLPISSRLHKHPDSIAAACGLCRLAPENVTKMAVVYGEWTVESGYDADAAGVSDYIDGKNGICIPYDLTGGLFGGDAGILGEIVDANGLLSQKANIPEKSLMELRRLTRLAMLKERIGYEKWSFSIKTMEFMSGGRGGSALADLLDIMSYEELSTIVQDEEDLLSLMCVNCFGEQFGRCPELDRILNDMRALATIWTSQEATELLGFTMPSLLSGLKDISDIGMKWVDEAVKHSGVMDMVEAYYSGVPVEDILGGMFK